MRLIEYQITLFRTSKNEGKAIAHEARLPPCVEDGDEFVSIFSKIVVDVDSLDGFRVEDMEIFARARERAQELANEAQPFRVRPLAVLEIAPE